MEFFELVKNRRSVRMFTDEPVSDETILKILDAVRLAPSAGNLQPFEMRVVKDKNILRELAKAAYGQGFVARAPFAIVFIEDSERSSRKYGRRGSDLYTRQDTAIAATYAHLAATDLSLGSCWVGAFDSPAAARILNLRDGLVPTVILPIGYPAEKPEASSRRSLEDLIPE